MELEASQYGLDPNSFVLFVFCREPMEIERIKAAFNTITVLIDRPQEKLNFSNHADMNVGNYDYDVIIKNDGSLESLRDMAKVFCENLQNS